MTDLTTLHWSGHTDRGRFRANNEDTFLIGRFDAREFAWLGKEGHGSLAEADYLFAVSDGMGGERSGEFASRITVDHIVRLLPRVFQSAAQGMTLSRTEVLSDLVAAIHRQLIALGQAYDECRNMGATLTLIWLSPEILTYAHIGDSRLYHWSERGGLLQISHDHTHVGWMRRQGQLNEREARTHPRRNALNKALGASNQFAEPQLGTLRLDPGDRLLLCTDGITDALWDRALAEACQRGTPARTLVQEAVAESGRDNTTAVILDVG